jgi:hypothetical protein
MFIDLEALLRLAVGAEGELSESADAWRDGRQVVEREILRVLDAAHEQNKPVGLWSRFSSLSPELVRFLVCAGTDAISIPLESVPEVIREVAATENSLDPVCREARPRPEC